MDAQELIEKLSPLEGKIFILYMYQLTLGAPRTMEDWEKADPEVDVILPYLNILDDKDRPCGLTFVSSDVDWIDIREDENRIILYGCGTSGRKVSVGFYRDGQQIHPDWLQVARDDLRAYLEGRDDIQ